VRANTGALVPLNSVARLASKVGPSSITHLGQLPSVTISFNLAPGEALGDAITKINAAMADIQAPATLIGSYQGAAQVFQSSLAGMGTFAGDVDFRDLSGAGDPLRELHTSAHDPVRIAYGGHGPRC